MNGSNGNKGRGIVVQERDRHLLRELAVMRVVDREQVKVVAKFGSTTRVNARLLALSRAGLLRRFFVGTDGAGRKALYGLSRKGALLADVPLRGPQRRADERVYADYFVEHQLAINEVYCSLKYGHALPVGVRFHRWLAFYGPLSPSSRLIPDGYVELETASGSVGAFLEVDLGHERRRIWQEKVRNYLQLAISGEFARLSGRDQFRVMVIASTGRKLESIRQVVAASTDKIFWFASQDSVRRGFFGSIWLRPKSREPQPFIRETPL
jgi:Replication-relaxation